MSLRDFFLVLLLLVVVGRFVDGFMFMLGFYVWIGGGEGGWSLKGQNLVF